jgi:hypothetical protein
MVLRLVESCKSSCEEKSCKSVVVKRKLYVCCSYRETLVITVLKSVARIRLVKADKN